MTFTPRTSSNWRCFESRGVTTILSLGGGECQRLLSCSSGLCPAKNLIHNLITDAKRTQHEKATTFFSYTKSLFSSDNHQSMKTSGSDLKVNRNIYLDAATCDRMRLIGPKCDQLGPINHCLLEESQWENKLFLSTQDWDLSLDVNRF